MAPLPEGLLPDVETAPAVQTDLPPGLLPDVEVVPEATPPIAPSPAPEDGEPVRKLGQVLGVISSAPDNYAGIEQTTRVLQGQNPGSNEIAKLVEQDYPAWKKAAEEVNRDPQRFWNEKRELARTIIEHPESAPTLQQDQKVSWFTDLMREIRRYPIGGAIEAIGLATPVGQVAAIGKGVAAEAVAAAGFGDTAVGRALGADEGWRSALPDLSTASKKAPEKTTVQKRDLEGVSALVDYAKYSWKQNELSVLGTNMLRRNLQLVANEAHGENEQTIAESRKLAHEARMDYLRLKGELGAQPDYGQGPLVQLGIDALQGGTSSVLSLGARFGVGGAAAGVAGAVALGVTKSPAAAGKAAKIAYDVVGDAATFGASFTLEAGSAYPEFLDQVDDSGKPMDPTLAAGAALLYGAGAALIETETTKAQLGALGPVGEFLKRGEKKAFLEAMLKDPTKRSILRRVATGWAKGAAAEGVEEGSQQAWQTAVGYLLQTASAGAPQVFDREKAWDDITESAYVGAVGGAVGLGSVGSLVHTATYLKDYGSSQRAGATVAAVAGLTDSDAARAAPVVVAKLVQRETDASGEKVSALYVDPVKLVDTLKTGGVDREEGARLLMGEAGPQRLQEALAARVDRHGGRATLEVPIAEYVERWGAKGIAQELVNDTTTRPGYFTLADQAEIEKFAAEQPEKLKQEILARYAEEEKATGQPPRPQTATEARLVDAVTTQLEATGQYTAEQARELVATTQALLETQAAVFGQSADVLAGNVTHTVTAEQATTHVPGLEHLSAEATAEVARALGGDVAAQQRIARLAFSDAMTPLGNRAAWEDFTSRPRGGVWVAADLNDFKVINDTAGHDRGDAVIKMTGGTLSTLSRKNGGKGFRPGGDEFNFHFSTMTQAQAFLDQAQAEVAKLEEAYPGHKVSMSLGAGADKARADAALYRAKARKEAAFGTGRKTAEGQTESSVPWQPGHGQSFAEVDATDVRELAFSAGVSTEDATAAVQAAQQLAPGAEQGLELDPASGQTVFDVDAAAEGMIEAEGKRRFQGIETPHRGRYLRGSDKTAGKAESDKAHNVVARLLGAIPRVLSADGKPEVYSGDAQWKSVEEALAWSKKAKYLEPIVNTDDRNELRWGVKKQGGTWVVGNDKMAFPNAAYPHGRNTWDDFGCGRRPWAEANGLEQIVSCYGGKCYADALAKGKNGKESDVTTGARPIPLHTNDVRRQTALKLFRKGGLEAVKLKFPDLIVSEIDKKIIAERVEAGRSDYPLSLKTVPGEAQPAVVYTKLQPANGQDIRLGVDTDGGAWLSSKEVMDAIVEANPRLLSVYSSAYHTPPPAHPLSRRTIINVTVSGWHPIGETLSRLRWAEEARANGWNVMLREVTADPDVHGEAKASVYNRLHEALLGTDFFMMQQPLHEGKEHGKELWGLPGCCIGSKKNPHKCDQCEVTEGIGNRSQAFWGIAEEPNKPGEKLLPDVAGFTALQKRGPAPETRGTTTYSGPLADRGKAPLVDAVREQGAKRLFQHGPVDTGSPAFQRWFAGSKVVDAEGRPLRVFHGTGSHFDTFSITNDIGFHFGTADQANTVNARVNEDVTSEFNTSRVMPVYLSIKKPLRVPDLFTWDPVEVMRVFADRGIISEKQADEGTSEPIDIEWVRKKLEAKGYDGLVYHNDSEGKGDSYIALRPEQIKSAISNTGDFAGPKILEQGTPGGPKGWIDLHRDAAQLVAKTFLTKSADVSTVVHEQAHLYFELMRDLAARDDAPQRVKDDAATLLAWLGVDSWAKVGREEDERLARGFEAYMLEGRAPSLKLVETFQRIRLWLLAIYKHVRDLNVELTPEVRGVFDRLLATDAEIEQARTVMGAARPVFQGPEQAGMTPEQWQAHLDKLAKSASLAAAEAQRRVYEQQQVVTTKEFKAAEKVARAQAEEEYTKLPGVVALDQLLHGPLIGTKRLAPDLGKLDRGKAHYVLNDGRTESGTSTLEDKLSRAGRLVENGEDPEDVAARLGFPSAKAMFTAVDQVPARDAYVQSQTEALVRQQHPELFAEMKRLDEIASSALHGQATSDWLLSELADLRRRATGAIAASLGAPDAPAETIRAAADAIVAGRSARVLAPNQALASERAAADRAVEAAAKGDFGAAYVAKQQQVLHHYIFKALERAVSDRTAFLKLARKLSKDDARARLGKAAPVYRDVVDSLLEAVGVVDPRDSSTPRDADVGLLVDTIQASGGSVAFDPELIRDLLAHPREWQSLTNAQVAELGRSLVAIRRAANQTTKALVRGKQVEADFVAAEIVREAAENMPNRGPEPSSQEAMTLAQKLSSGISTVDAYLLKPETMLDMMGGGKTDSMVYRAIVEPLQHAKAREHDLLRTVTKPLVEAFESVPREVQQHLNDGVDGQALFPDHIASISAPTKRYEILMMALNWGNASNRQRLLDGRNITAPEVEKALSMLTSHELEWVQRVHDAAEALWPEMRDLEERDTGIAPEPLKPLPYVVSTSDGKTVTMRGGYHPAVYDRRASNVGMVQAGSVASLLDGSYTRPGTSHGHLKGRVEKVAEPIALDPTIVQRHFFQATHDVAYREAIKSVGRILFRDDVREAMRQSLGVERRDTFLTWLKDVGAMRAAQVDPHAGAIRRWVQAARSNVVLGTLGYAIDNFVGDLTSVGTAVASGDVKAHHLAASMAEFTKSPAAFVAQAREKSGEMRTRQDELVREFGREMRTMTQSQSTAARSYRSIRDNGFWIAEQIDTLNSSVVWFARYRQSINEGRSEVDAVADADRIVRKNVPSHNVLDKAAVQRDRGPLGASVAFYGYMSVLYQIERNIWHGAYTAEGVLDKTTATAKALAQHVALVALTGLLAEFLVGRGPEPDDGDDEMERWRNWGLRKLLVGTIAPVPFAAPLIEGVVMKRQPSQRFGPLYSILDETGRAAWTAYQKGDDPEKVALSVLRAAGIFAGIPTRPLRWFQGIERAVRGDSSGPAETASDIVYGHRQSQPANPITAVAGALQGASEGISVASGGSPR